MISDIDESAVYKFSPSDNVQIYEISGDSSSGYSLSQYSNDDLIYTEGKVTKMFVATSTNSADATFDIMYQAGYTMTLAAVSLAAVTFGSLWADLST